MRLENVRPLRDGIVVKVVDHRSATSGLIIPTDPSRMRADHDCWATQYKVRWAEVIRVGPGKKSKKGNLIPTTVKPGDLVSFAGMTKTEDLPYVVIQEADVLLVDSASGPKPLNGRLLVKRIEQGDTSKCGLFIPDTAKEKPQMAEVVAASGGEVKAGDHVFYHESVGAEIKLDGQSYLAMREDEIFCVIESPEKSLEKALNVAA